MTTQAVSLIDDAQWTRLQGWQGRVERSADRLAAAPVDGLAATLDRDDPPAAEGEALPPLGHWLAFLPRARQRDIGTDGHPRREDGMAFLPPVPLPRRMWAGGRLDWVAGNPLRIGEQATRTSCIESLAHKAGRSGDLVFVTVRHEIANTAGLALTEWHDIVYRAAARAGEAAPPPVAAETDAPWLREVVPDPVMLFRYSALTFNGHRIHYDRPYVTGVEGYPGLVVHGPLIATLLVDLLRRHAPGARLAAFRFKAVRPTFDIHLFRLYGRPAADGRRVALWASDHEGWLTMQAEVEVEG